MKSDSDFVGALLAPRLASDAPRLTVAPPRFASPAVRLPLRLRGLVADPPPDLVAVLATVPSDSRRWRLSLPARRPMWLDRRRDARAGSASDEPQHGRLRPRAGLGCAAGAARDA